MSRPIVIVTGTTQLAEVGKHYVLVNAALTTVTLPASMVASDAVIAAVVVAASAAVLVVGDQKATLAATAAACAEVSRPSV